MHSFKYYHFLSHEKTHRFTTQGSAIAAWKRLKPGCTDKDAAKEVLVQEYLTYESVEEWAKDQAREHTEKMWASIRNKVSKEEYELIQASWVGAIDETKDR